MGSRGAPLPFAPMVLLSASGALRTILILLIIWQLLRLWMRTQEQRQRPHHGPTPPRPKGDVRIEQLQEPKHHAPPLDAEDAEFEEIK